MKKFLYLVATDQINGVAISILKGALWILSKVYGAVIVLRGALYRIGLFKSYKLSAPVVSIGNLTMGGVGKTPLVEFVARELRKKNIQPVILMRGYMDQDPEGSNQESDEAAMLRSRLMNVPVLVGADRLRNAKTFLEKSKADVFLLDDGFQHWRIARQMNIVAIDATDPSGNGHLLPRGVLREPKRALRRADMFILTKADLAAEEHLEKLKVGLRAINSGALIIDAVHEPVAFVDLRSGKELDLAALQGLRVAAVSGIGSPGSFLKTLDQLGAEVAQSFAFMDHHAYTSSDLIRIAEVCQKEGIVTVVTTEKDAVKLKNLLGIFPDDTCVLSLKIKILIVKGEDHFFERIHRIL